MFMKKKNLVAILMIMGLSAPLAVFSAGLKVFPSAIKVSGGAGESFKQTITIENPGKTPASFLVYPDDFPKNLKLTPSDFILQPQETKQVFLEASFPAGGIFGTNISVVAKPLSDGSLKANAGIKIHFQAVIESSSKAKFLGFLGMFFNQRISLGYLLIILVIILLLVLLFRRIIFSRPARS